MTDTWCIVHGLPGRDPLTVEGPFADEGAAAAKAGLHAQVRPDVPAIVDVLVHPDNVDIEHVGGFPAQLRSELKHGSYAPPQHSTRIRELLQNLEHRIASLESHLEDQGLAVAAINADDQNRLWAETRERDHTTGPMEDELRAHVQQLLLVGERLGRVTSSLRGRA